MEHTCYVCGKQFTDAPYYIREGRIMLPVCSKDCLDLWYKRGW